jgi:uncharacterized protein (DUF2249 family)
MILWRIVGRAFQIGRAGAMVLPSGSWIASSPKLAPVQGSAAARDAQWSPHCIAAFALTAHRDLILDVRHIPFWHRLDAILRAFDRLGLGEALELLVDIDPWPLRTYLEATRAVPFDWQYLESGPQTWRVRLRRDG